MTVSEFWNHAFLAALVRLDAEKARGEADKALQLAIDHWQSTHEGMRPVWTPYAQLPITDIKKPAQSTGNQGTQE